MNYKEEDSDYFQADEFKFSEGFQDFLLIYSGKSSPSEIFSAVKGLKRFTIKCLKSQYRDDPFFITQLKKEFEIGYLIDHPNIVRYYSFENIKDKGYCIVREWVDGLSLNSLIEDKKIDKSKILKIINELLEALEYLHKRQIAHKDIKPSNIIITYQGEHVKLIDFGFSDSPSFSKIKISGGTEDYASPEQKGLSDYSIDYKSDLFSLGILIKKLPFKKNRKLNSLVQNLISANPSKRPEIKEIQKYLNSSVSTNKKHLQIIGRFLWVIFLVLTITLFITIKFFIPQSEITEKDISTTSRHELESDSNLALTTNLEKSKTLNNSDSLMTKNEFKKISDNAENVTHKTVNSNNIANKKEEKIRTDVHPLEIITYNQTLASATKFYKLYPDSITNWKDTTISEISRWINSQTKDDAEVASKCFKSLEIALQEFEKNNSISSSN